MDEKKKNGLIRALGRLGRRVKFLQKPLTVLVVLGVSIHHLFRKLFFDVNYHAARMRALTTAVCLALLCTLFVIPAIAENMIEMSVTTEYIDSTPEVTPTPLPEEITPDEGETTEVIETTDGDGTNPADVNGAAGEGAVTENPDGTGDGTEGTGDGTDAVTPTDDGTQPAEGETPTLDENGNPLPTESAESNRRDGLAVRALYASDPTVNKEPNLNVSSNKSSVEYNDDITLTATPSTKYTAGEALGPGFEFVSSRFEYLWSVSATWAGKNYTRYFTTDYEPGASPLEKILNYENFYGFYHDVPTDNDLFFGSGTVYSFTCKVREVITYKRTEDGSTAEYKNDLHPASKSVSVTINKKEVTYAAITFPDPFNGAAKDVYVDTNGNLFSNPSVANSEEYPNGASLSLRYKLTGGSYVVTAEPGSGSNATYFFQNEEDQKYKASVVFADGFTSTNYKLGSGGDEVATEKEINMLCIQDLDPDSIRNIDTYVNDEKAEPVTVSGLKWVQKLEIYPNSGYRMATNLNAKDYSYTGGKKFSAEEGGPISNGVYKETCPTQLYFSKDDQTHARIKGVSRYDGVYIDKTGPAIADEEFSGANIIEIDPDVPGDPKRWYAKGDFNFSATVKDLQKGKDDTDVTGSGMKKVFYTLSNTEIKQDGSSIIWKDASSSGDTYSGAVEFAEFPGFDDSKAGYVCIMAVDNVGNKSFTSKRFEMKDTDHPVYTCLESGQIVASAATEADAVEATFYIAEGRELDIEVTDPTSGILNKTGVTEKNGQYSVSPDAYTKETGKNKYMATLKFTDANAEESGKHYTFCAKDLAGNESWVKINLIKSTDTSQDVDVSEIDFGSAIYGYEIGSGTGNVAPKKIDIRKDPQAASIRINKVVVNDTTASPDKTAFEAVINDDGTFTVQPAEQLHVKGVTNWQDLANTCAPYQAVLDIDYTLYKVVGGVESIIDEHVARKPVKFTVIPKDLTLTYKPTEAENYHTREYIRDAQKWFEWNMVTGGFVYGQGELVLGDFVPVISYDAAASPDILVSNNTGALTADGYVIADGVLDFTLSNNVPAVEAGAANQYDYYYPKTTTAISGRVTCERRVFEDAYTLESFSDYNKEDVGTTGQVPGYEDWYVEDMMMKSIDEYLIYDATEYDPDTEEYSDKYGEDGFKVDVDMSDASLEGLDFEGKDMFKVHDGTGDDLFYDPGDGTPVDKFYYIMDKETREISVLSEKTIRIDTTNPGYDGTTDPLSIKPPRAIKPYTDPEAGIIDDPAYHPYFHIEKNIWREFWYTVTFRMYFNDIMDVKVKCKYDNQSDIDSTHITIFSKEPPYETEDELAADTSVVWDEFTDDAHISEENEKSGFIYIKITNKAGLNCYVRSQPFLVIDSKGPDIKADHEGEKQLDGFTHAVEDKDDFVANTVTFQISDEQSLFWSTVNDAGEEIPARDSSGKQLPAIKVYKGTEIGMGATMVTSCAVQLDPATNKPVPGKDKEIRISLPAYDDDYYTIVAKDNSGMTTIRYFRVSTPVYSIGVESVEFDTETYGTPLGQKREVKWKQTGNATPTIENVIITDGPFTAEKDDSGKWFIKPPSRPDAGVISGTFRVIHSGGKWVEGKCSMTVLKKLLVAEYQGCTIYQGQPLTNKEVIIDDSQLVYDDTILVITEWPKVTIPEYPSETMIITPKGGSAQNYRFDDASNISGVVTVLTDKASEGTHYTVEGTLSNTGWYVSNIKLKPKTGYALSLDSSGSSVSNEINIYDDTNAGVQKFYIKNAAQTGDHAGEVYEQSVFNYKKDTVDPYISGVTDGETYQANAKTVTVTDDYLYRVTVNGIMKEVKNGKAVFDILPDQKESVFFITAEDCAGHIATSTVTMQQLDGVDDDEDVIGNDNYNPDDDIIQDDTDDADDDAYLGTLTKRVQLVDGAPTTAFTSTNRELRTSVLNANERKVMREGSDANVTLRVQNINGTVSQSDKELVIASLGDYTVAQYLDITLWKTVGNGSEKQVTKTNGPISMTITIPSEFRYSPNGRRRQFAIVRVHNNATAVLQDEDSAANTITISSSKFSVYALAYRDVNAGGSGSGNSDAGSGSGSGSGSGAGSGSGSGSGSGGSGYSGSGSGIETGGPAAPQTGDRAPVVPTAIAFGVALIGMIVAIIIRRRMDYEWVYVDEDGNIIENSEEE